jgi:hypothetical protein
MRDEALTQGEEGTGPNLFDYLMTPEGKAVADRLLGVIENVQTAPSVERRSKTRCCLGTVDGRFGCRPRRWPSLSARQSSSPPTTN